MTSRCSVKIAVILETNTGEDQRSVIRFLCSEGVKSIEILRPMKLQYGDTCLLKTVFDLQSNLKTMWTFETSATVETITDLHFERLSHLLHSPDLAPSDYHIFGPLERGDEQKKLSRQKKMCNGRYRSGCVLDQKISIQISIYFVRARGTASKLRRKMMRLYDIWVNKLWVKN